MIFKGFFPLHRVLALLVGLTTSTYLLAATSLQPVVVWESGHVDNLRLSPDNEDEASFTSLDARLRLISSNGSVRARVDGGLKQTEHFGTLVDSTNSSFADAHFRFDRKRWSVGAILKGNKDSLLRTGQQFSPGDAVVAPDLSLGQEEGDFDRRRWEASPYVILNIGKSQSFQLAYTFQDTNFDSQGESAGYVDAQFKGYSVVYKNQYTKKTAFTIRAGDVHLKPEAFSDHDVRQVTIGFESQISPTLNLQLEGGQQRTKADGQSSESGFVVKGQLSRSFKSGRLTALAERNIYPNSFGSVSEVDRFIVEFDRSFSSKWSSSTRVSARNYDLQRNNTNRDDERYYEFSQTISRQFGRSFSAGLTFAHRRSDVNGRDSKANAISLSVTYRPGSRLADSLPTL